MSQKPTKLLRRPKVEERTGLSTTSIYEQMEAGTFPRPVPIGPRAVAWPEQVVEQWIQDRIAAANAE